MAKFPEGKKVYSIKMPSPPAASPTVGDGGMKTMHVACPPDLICLVGNVYALRVTVPVVPSD